MTGVCVAQTPSGIQFDRLEAGAAVGHLDCMLGTLCGAHVVSKTYCTLYRLLASDLAAALEVRLTLEDGQFVSRPRQAGCRRR